jgi:hypothetical protein
MADDGFTIKRTNDNPDALYVVQRTDRVELSIVAFDWDWTFLGRRLRRIDQKEMDLRIHDRIWWHRMTVEAVEEMKLHIRIDDLHVSVYVGDHNPTPESIEQLKAEYALRGPHTIQIHTGNFLPSTHLPANGDEV